jgi:hypothetical protein
MTVLKERASIQEQSFVVPKDFMPVFAGQLMPKIHHDFEWINKTKRSDPKV